EENHRAIPRTGGVRFRPVIFVAVRVHALIRMVVSHPADLAAAVQIEPEHLPGEGVLVRPGLGVGGEQDQPGGWREAMPLKWGVNQFQPSRAPVMTGFQLASLQSPSRIFFCPSTNRALAMGAPLGALGQPSSPIWPVSVA